MQSLGTTTFVETGIDMAETVSEVSRWFAERDPKFGKITGSMTTGARPYNAWNEDIHYPEFEGAQDSKYTIHSVDLDQYSYRNACKIFQHNPNITFHHQSSEEFLRDFVDQKITSGSTDEYFFFFDAHWRKYWPLRDELRAVSRLKRFAVCIDDVFIPGKSDARHPHGDYGYEVHRGTVLDWSYLRVGLETLQAKLLYSRDYNRDKRGWMLILVGYSAEELARLDREKFIEFDGDDPKHTQRTALHPLAILDFRNLLKRIVPTGLLRSTVRLYQRMT